MCICICCFKWFGGYGGCGWTVCGLDIVTFVISEDEFEFVVTGGFMLYC